MMYARGWTVTLRQSCGEILGRPLEFIRIAISRKLERDTQTSLSRLNNFRVHYARTRERGRFPFRARGCAGGGY